MGNIFEEYALLEAEISALELKKEQLKPFILKSMVEQGIKSMDAGVGKFTVSMVKKWSFPENIVSEVTELDKEIKIIKDEIKSVQEKAISTKEATCEVTPSLRFTPIKL